MTSASPTTPRRGLKTLQAFAVATLISLASGIGMIGTAGTAAADPGQPVEPAAPTTQAPGSDDPALTQSVREGEEASTEPAVVDIGHVDIGPRLIDGHWSVMARDDSGETPVWRDPANLVLHVKDEALLAAPTDEAYSFMEATEGEQWFVVPQVQNPAVVWLGWNTQDPGVVAAADRGATMTLGPVTGPGRSWLFIQNGTFGEPLELVNGQNPAPQDVWVDINTHVHANWVFTSPGVYLARLTFAAKLTDGSVESATTVLRFAVGSATSPQEALAADASAVLADLPAAGEDAVISGDENAQSETDSAIDAAEDSGPSAAVQAIAGVITLAIIGGVVALIIRSRNSRKEIAQARAESLKARLEKAQAAVAEAGAKAENSTGSDEVQK